MTDSTNSSTDSNSIPWGENHPDWIPNGVYQALQGGGYQLVQATNPETGAIDFLATYHRSDEVTVEAHNQAIQVWFKAMFPDRKEYMVNSVTVVNGDLGKDIAAATREADDDDFIPCPGGTVRYVRLEDDAAWKRNTPRGRRLRTNAIEKQRAKFK